MRRLLLGFPVVLMLLVPREEVATGWDVDGDGVRATTDPDADGDGIANAEDIVASARALAGGPSDPLWGHLRGFGFRVCTDVALDAFARAGLPLAAATGSDDPWSARRVRLLRERFAPVRSTPRPGDLAFYGDHHVAIVTSVADGYRVVEARGPQVAEVPGAAVSRALGEVGQFVSWKELRRDDRQRGHLCGRQRHLRGGGRRDL